MSLIRLEIDIVAPIERCFDLARSLDLHQISTSKTKEYIVGGKQTGLINLNETVTWRAKHFGIWQNLTSRITSYERPFYFCDEMEKGAFKSFKHQHKFLEIDTTTRMIDVFDFESPFGIIGELFNNLILTSYLEKFLLERNQIIKEFAETDKWKKVL